MNRIIKYKPKHKSPGSGMWHISSPAYSFAIVDIFTLFFCIFLTFSCPPTVLANDSGKILILGDSISAGYGIPEGKGWVSLLQNQLDKNRLEQNQTTLQIINDSISGDTTAGGLARLPRVLDEVHPDWVVIALGGNDGLRGQSLAAMKSNLSKMILLCHERGAKPLLLGMKLPPNYGKHYIQQFEEVYVNVSVESNTPLLPFFIEGIGGKTHYMQADRIHPNTLAQSIIRDNVWQFLEPIIKPLQQD